MKKITLFYLLTLFALVFANAQVFNQDYESFTVGDPGGDAGHQLSGGSSTIEIATGLGNTSKVLKAVHASGANDLYVRTSNIIVTEGEVYDVSFDVVTSNGIHVVTMRCSNDDVAPFVQVNADAPASSTNGAQGGANPGRIVENANNTFGTTTASFTVPAGYNRARIQIYNFGAANTMEIDNFSVTLNGTASVTDLAKFNFKSYPNPASECLNISAVTNIDKIEVYNLLGQEVKNEVINSRNANVNISSLSNGVYLVKAFIQDAVGTYKFIKK
ncbi:T9SS type A sorting domain-containing protein [Litoribaculum gwangyangense]|uniref:Secretion system C-terminal sorting domain-containing protein n=1 Tax=Litoribaculum gwangyangense TaxID=1130722 RepID=A0ABP9CF12_9FLAO